MASKKQKINIYAIPNEAGTKALEAFLANSPDSGDIGSLLQNYAQKEEKKDRVAAIKLLLAQPDIEGFNLQVSLRYACSRGYAETVSLLLAHPKADCNDLSHGSALCEAILQKETECALLLLQAGADPNLAPNKWPAFTKGIPSQQDGPSPLLNAIRVGDRKVVEALIKAKVDVNAETFLCRRPLDVATELSQTEIVTLLTKAGAKHISPDELDLEQATILGYPERVAYLLDTEKTDEAEQERVGRIAAANGKLAIIELLWKRGLSLQGKYSILQDAICHAHWELVTPLLAMGAPASTPDKKPDQSPLLLAAIGQRWDVLLELLKAGADPRLDRGVTKETALICTVRSNRIDIVEALLKAGADPNAKTLYRDTPISEAKKGGYKEIVKLLEASAKEPKAAKAKTPRKATKKHA
jgi:ankyrin repeat protein